MSEIENIATEKWMGVHAVWKDLKKEVDSFNPLDDQLRKKEIT